MKKLLLILLAGMAFSCPAQGMERIKSWLGLAKKQERVTEHNQASNEVQADQICGFCRDTLITNPPSTLTHLPCHSTHVFHKDCLDTWTASQISKKYSASCPMCHKVYQRGTGVNWTSALCFTAPMLYITWKMAHYHNGINQNLIILNSYKNRIEKLPKDNPYHQLFNFAKNMFHGTLWFTRCTSIPLADFGIGFAHKMGDMEYPDFKPRNLAVITASLATGFAYTQYFSSIFNDEAPTITKLAMMAPLAVVYAGASQLLQHEE